MDWKTNHPTTKKFLKDLPTVEGMSERHLLVLVSTCIMVATRTMGRIMRSMALVCGQLIRLGVFSFGRSIGRLGLGRGMMVVMGSRWDYLMTVALMLYYSL
jgi:hypothetical protein